MEKFLCRLLVGIVLALSGATQAAVVFRPDFCDRNEAANWTMTTSAPNGTLETDCVISLSLNSVDGSEDESLRWQGASRTVPTGVNSIMVNHLLGSQTAGLYASIGDNQNVARLIYNSASFGWWHGSGYVYEHLSDRCVPDDWCTLGMELSGGFLRYLINESVLGQVEVSGDYITTIALMALSPFGGLVTNNLRSTFTSTADDLSVSKFSSLEGFGPNRVEVPEPAMLSTLAIALLGLAWTRRHKNRPTSAMVR